MPSLRTDAGTASAGVSTMNSATYRVSESEAKSWVITLTSI